MRQVLVEACVTSLEESLEAIRAGAARLEVCSALEVGGLTPSVNLVQAVRAASEVPIHVMVRLQAGTYQVGATDLAQMQRQIHELIAAGANGVVLGVLDRSDRVDEVAISELVRAADPAPVTFHRAFDRVPDQLVGLGMLIEAGVSRVLTSGGAETAWNGRDELRRLVGEAQGRITILGGGRVRSEHAVQLIRYTGLNEVHARSSAVPDLVSALRPMFRFDVFGYQVGVYRTGEEWKALFVGDEGRHREAEGVTIPSWISEQELARFLADLFHEAASPEHPDVVRLDAEEHAS